jgi:hypothetical protein
MRARRCPVRRSVAPSVLDQHAHGAVGEPDFDDVPFLLRGRISNTPAIRRYRWTRDRETRGIDGLPAAIGDNQPD